MKRITLVWLTLALFACANVCSATLEYRIVDLSESGSPEFFFYQALTASKNGDIGLVGYNKNTGRIVNVIRSQGVDHVITAPAGYSELEIWHVQSSNSFAGSVKRYNKRVPFVVRDGVWNIIEQYQDNTQVVGMSSNGEVLLSNGILWNNGVIRDFKAEFPQIEHFTAYNEGNICGRTKDYKPFRYTDYFQVIDLDIAVAEDIDSSGNLVISQWLNNDTFTNLYIAGSDSLFLVPRAEWFEEQLFQPMWLPGGGLMVSAAIYREERATGVILDGQWLRLPGLEGGTWVPDAGPLTGHCASDALGNIYGTYWSYQTDRRAVMWYLTPEPSSLLSLGMMAILLCIIYKKRKSLIYPIMAVLIVYAPAPANAQYDYWPEVDWILNISYVGAYEWTSNGNKCNYSGGSCPYMGVCIWNGLPTVTVHNGCGDNSSPASILSGGNLWFTMRYIGQHANVAYKVETKSGVTFKKADSNEIFAIAAHNGFGKRSSQSGLSVSSKWVLASQLETVVVGPGVSAYGYAFGKGDEITVSFGHRIDKYAWTNPQNAPPDLPASPQDVIHRFYTNTPAMYPRIPRGYDFARGGTACAGDPVDMATGHHELLPDQDLVIYNPQGPSPQFHRNYIARRAKSGGYGSPGLGVGWVDNYDVRLTPQTTGSSNLILTHANGAQETFIAPPNLQPLQQVEFSASPGVPYFVQGQVSSQVGQWDWIRIIWKDETKWRFEPANQTDGRNIYVLCAIANKLNQSIWIDRETDSALLYRIKAVHQGVSSMGLTLMTYQYLSSKLTSVTDVVGARKILFNYTSVGGYSCLSEVSQIQSATASSGAMIAQYGYTVVAGKPLMTSITSPHPSGSGTTSQTIEYDHASGKVSALVDANGIRHELVYRYIDGTIVNLRDPSSNAIVSSTLHNFDTANGNRDLGFVDEKGQATIFEYNDPDNPDKITNIIDKMGKEQFYQFDNVGNLVKSKDILGIETVYEYYPASAPVPNENPTPFKLGRLKKITIGTKTPETFKYYENGLVRLVTMPKPGETNGATVEVSMEYDQLGNMTKRHVPASAASGTKTTEWLYEVDPVDNYTQDAKIGQPLVVKEFDGTKTIMSRFRYDNRGNRIWAVDGEGRQVEYTYNLANQPVTLLEPQ